MRRGDLYIGLIILVIMGLLGLGYKFYVDSIGTDRFVEIKIDGKVYQKVKLTKDLDEKIPIRNDYGYNLIYIHDGGFEVVEADCANQVDVEAGFVKSPGKAVICVPHHLQIQIVGGKDSGPNIDGGAN